MKTATAVKTGLLMMPLTILTGCAAFQNEPVVYDQTFGQSVNQIKQAQILNPEAAQNPPLEPPKRLDGYAGQDVINSYREGFQQQEQVESVNINLGGSGGGSSGGGSN